MTEIEEMRKSIGKMEERISAMSQENIRMRMKLRILIGAFFAMTAFSFALTKGISAGTPNILTCRGVNVINEQGQPVVKLSYNDKGGVVQVNSQNGSGRARIDNGALGQGQLVTRGSLGEEQMSISSDEDGGALRICGHDQNTRVLLACQTGDPNAGIINIRDNKGKERVNIGSDVIGGQVTVGASEDALSGRFGADERGGFFYLYGADKLPHVVFASGENNVGIMNMRNSKGKNVVTIGYDKDGGEVIVHNSAGAPRAGLQVGQDGTGALSILDEKGKQKSSVQPAE
jgi:hypothetical protein